MIEEKDLRKLIASWNQYRSLQRSLLRIRKQGERKPDPKNVVQAKNKIENINKKIADLEAQFKQLEAQLDAQQEAQE